MQAPIPLMAWQSPLTANTSSEQQAEQLSIRVFIPDLKVIGAAELGGKGAAWLTLTPDGKQPTLRTP